ncbi:hypothetical protein H3146_04080 [Streptomyces sp. OF3]|uniref:Uncharacterized protein n=1 Tax=Streptomyces alkaliterrae TaxID=2213162 RepID=A0A7W3WHR8_9ACTN|nr:hypothetical protein [Streptomyces alkaliterrae]MBB1252554.1 hypothetical protein [Streptomyces alkaliterrae]
MPETTLTAPAPGAVLTPDQISVEAVYFGVRVVTCEDGDPLLALGTHDRRRALAAWSRYAREVAGERLRDYLSLCAPNCAAPWCTRYGCRTAESVVEPIWAVFRAPDPTAGQDPESVWYVELADPETPGALPVMCV